VYFVLSSEPHLELDVTEHETPDTRALWVSVYRPSFVVRASGLHELKAGGTPAPQENAATPFLKRF
jgi:hypothetical protein